MVKAVFFDWYNTLARYQPPREELLSQALKEYGIDVSPQRVLPGLVVADKDYFEANASRPIRERSPEEQAELFNRYLTTVLTMAGIDVPAQPGTLMKVMSRMQQLSQGLDFVLFDDVLPALASLKKRSFTIGLLTNLDRDMRPICRRLGLEPYVDLVITSAEVGADKPQPPIFLAALERAGVSASEAVHVGDHYALDVMGARGVGIGAILLDRFQTYPEIRDCTRISSLTELAGCLP